MAWYLAPALDTLRVQINTRWPDRDRTSDGTIGDAAHSARLSDHNPDPTSAPPDIVRAFDIDEDGIDTGAVILAMLADARTRYVIYEAQIWERVTGKWRAYVGPNLHRHHIHISVRSVENYAYNPAPWAIPALPAPPAPAPPAPNLLQEEEMILYLKGDKAPAVYAFDTSTGTRRAVDLPEWNVITKAGVPTTTVAQADLDAITRDPGSR
jgi:hypothetical protein